MATEEDILKFRATFEAIARFLEEENGLVDGPPKRQYPDAVKKAWEKGEVIETK